MSGHTPGPWIDSLEEPHFLVVRAGSRRIAEVFTDDAFPLSEEPNVTACRNAKLLAAAPTLLEACRESLMWQAEGEYGDPIPEEYWTPAYRKFMQRLRFAIDKAGGE